MLDYGDYILIGAKVDTRITENEMFWEDNHSLLIEHEVGKIAYLYDVYIDGEQLIIGIPLQIEFEEGLNYFEPSDFDREKYSNIIKKHVKDKFGMSVETQLIVIRHFYDE